MARAPNGARCPECGILMIGSLVDHCARFHEDSLPRLLTPDPSEPREPLKGEQRARLPIPKAVKVQVWQRDEGRCRKCGITDDAAMLRDGEHLHYDHAWPWSLNGADTVDNIQLLCGPCNREKAARFEP